MRGMTIDEVKAILRITGTQYDSYLTTILPLIEEFVADYCNRDFINPETGQVDYPGGVKVAIAKLCEYNMKDSQVQSETLARHSVTYASSTTQFPAEISKMLRPYCKVVFV